VVALAPSVGTDAGVGADERSFSLSKTRYSHSLNGMTAANTSRCGVFLFTKDDALEDRADGASPRDNVLLEAGYFLAAKGKDRVLIVREEGAKMPADLGGDIYVPLKDRREIASIETKLQQFVKAAVA